MGKEVNELDNIEDIDLEEFRRLREQAMMEKMSRFDQVEKDSARVGKAYAKESTRRLREKHGGFKFLKLLEKLGL